MRRRTFLGLGAGLSVAIIAGCSLPVIPKRPEATVEDALGWISAEGDGYVLYLPRTEMGQNVATALKQIACDELGATWDAVEVRLPATTQINHVRATVGSDSVKDFALPLAQACATLREAQAAGKTSGELMPEPRPMHELKAFAANARYVGRSTPLVHADAIVTGAALYTADVRLPGMLHGRVLRAPTSPEVGARPVAWNAEAAHATPGFVMLVDDPLLQQANSAGLGIIARTPGALDRIAAALDVQWQSDGSFETQDLTRTLDIDRRLAAGSLSHQLAEDRLDRTAAWDVDLRLDVPAAAHAPMEPRAAVASFTDDGLQLWAGTQDAFYVRDVMVSKFGLDADKVAVHAQRVGGAFGGKTICTVELEAAVLARAAQQPVKVQWTRAQEFRQGFHRSPSSHRIRARVHDGQVTDWWHGFASGHIIFTNAAMPAWMQRFADFVGDMGVARGAVPPYAITRRRIEHDQIRLPLLTGPWRGLGAAPNALAVESAMDECARHAGQDPLAFRLAHIDDPRLAVVLKRAAAAAGEGTARSGWRSGRGIACGIYKEASYAAVIAGVAVDSQGQVQVAGLWCAHDCGRLINPDQVQAQCEGNLVWGLGMVLREQLPVAAGGIDAESFFDLALPRLDDVPPMQIVLIETDHAPTGAGETVIVAAAGAIANAVRDATGVRPSRLPVQPDDLLG